MREIKFRVFMKPRDDLPPQMYYNFDPLILPTVHENTMQYTGLKDKKGVEIYEGDVLNTDSGGKRVVEYLEDQAMFMLRTLQGATPKYVYCVSNGRPRSLEIIGNIYELLEVK